METRSVPSRIAPSRTLVERVGWVPLACVIGVICVVAAANLTWITSPYYGKNDDQTSQARAVNVGKVPVTGKVFAALLSPNRIEIPKLKARAPIVKVSTTSDGELEIPVNPKVVGWWSPGAKPGAKKGTAILAGHINYSGVTGTLADIGTLKPNDEVDVFGVRHGKKTEIMFKVTGVRTYHKTRLPYKEIFDQQSIGRLAIVTCGGPFDASTGNYLDNIVAFAVAVGERKA